MSDIFISYQRRDKYWAETLSKALEAQGWSTWWDRQLVAGQRFDDVIDEQIKRAKCVVVLWSSNSVKSHWVKEEAKEGADLGKLVSVFIEEIRLPFGYRHIHTLSLVGWNHSINDSLLNHFFKDVEHVVGTHKTFLSESDLPSTYTDRLGIEFMLIKPGAFMMGSKDGNEDEKPNHHVNITQSFYVGKYPVTQAQWKAVTDFNPSIARRKDNHPVEAVSWNDVQTFLEMINMREEKYRLPTEAEWEYACRAGTEDKFFWGNDEAKLPQYAFCNMKWFEAHGPVGTKKPNPWGLHDMLGNVWEWVHDRYDIEYYAKSHEDNPCGPERGSYRVLRGGSFFDVYQYCNNTVRGSGHENYRSFDVGFRLILCHNSW